MLMNFQETKVDDMEIESVSSLPESETTGT